MDFVDIPFNSQVGFVLVWFGIVGIGTSIAIQFRANKKKKELLR